MKRLFLATFLTCVLAVSLFAEQADTLKTLRPVTSVFMAEAGSAKLADTYLTPLFYTGLHTGLAYEHNQAMGFDPRNWVRQLSVRASFDYTRNPARNANMINAEVEARWGMMLRRRVFTPGLTVGVGPAIDARAGVLYLSHNGNNPASAKGSVTIDAIGFAAWRTQLGRLPITLRYQADLPVAGVFFAPDYGQLYYEIWLGERSGLVHPAVWGQYFRMDNLVTADLSLGATTLRIGYHNDVISTKTQGIVSRRIYHAFTLGIVTEWISLNTRNRQQNEAKIFSAIY